MSSEGTLTLSKTEGGFGPPKTEVRPMDLGLVKVHEVGQRQVTSWMEGGIPDFPCVVLRWKWLDRPMKKKWRRKKWSSIEKVAGEGESFEIVSTVLLRPVVLKLLEGVEGVVETFVAEEAFLKVKVGYLPCELGFGVPTCTSLWNLPGGLLSLGFHH